MMTPAELTPILCPESAVPTVLALEPRLAAVGQHLSATILDGPLPDVAILRRSGLEIERLLDRHHLLYGMGDREGRATVERALFDLLSDSYEDEIDVENNLDNLRFLASLVGETANVRDERRVFLDYGCGTGLSLSLELAPGFRLIGCDASPRMRGIASRRGMRVLSPTELTLLPDGFFHGAIAAYVLHLAVPEIDIGSVVRTLRAGARLAANFHKGTGVADVERILERIGFMSLIRLPLAVPSDHGEYRLWLRL